MSSERTGAGLQILQGDNITVKASPFVVDEIEAVASVGRELIGPFKTVLFTE